MTDRKHTKHDDEKRPARGAAKVKIDIVDGDMPETAVDDLAAAADVTPAMAEQIDELIAERDSYVDHLQRLQADYDNYRKREQRNAEERRLRAAEDVVVSLLPVMDNMARALDAAARHEEGQLIAGLELVAGQLRGTLEGHGLEEIAVEAGTLFDPNVHEAVLMQASDDHDEGTVLQVLEAGYLLHGRLLRPAKVIVAS